MEQSKRQPEEHEVLQQIHEVISENPDFGSKRVASSLKSSNPHWTIGDKRVSKLLKKYKSSTSMSSEDTSAASPWNVAPASTSPQTSSPWAVSPFQTSNPFKKSPGTPPTDSEPEPDVVNHAVMEELSPRKEEETVVASAFESTQQEQVSSAWTAEEPKQETPEPVKEVVEEPKEETQASPWTTTPMEEATSPWTSTPVVEKVVEPAKAVEETKPVVQEPEEVVHEVVVEHLDETPVEKEVVTPAVVEEANEAVEDAPASPWTAATMQEEVVEIPAVVEETPAPVVEEVEEVAEEQQVSAPMEVEEAPVKEEPVEAASPWTTAPVEEPSVSTPAKEEVVEEVHEEPPTPVVEEPAPVVEEVAEVVEEAPVVEETPTVSAWNTTPVQDEVAKKEEVVDIPAAVKSTLVKETVVAEVDTKAPVEVVAEPTTSAWTTAPVQEEVIVAAPIKEEPVKEEVFAVVEEVAAPIEKVVAAVETKVEEEVPALSSAWNSTPVQEEVKPVVAKVEKVVAPVKKELKVVEPVKEVVVEKKQVAVEQPKQTPATAVQEVVVATEAVVEDAKLDKKAVANAFDGVASYQTDSVAPAIKKVPSVEARAAKATDAPGACGACACTIQ